MKLFKTGFIYYVLATILVNIILVYPIIGDPILPAIDGVGWVFYLTSCLSHAAVLMLILFLVFFLPWALLRCRRLAASLFVLAVGLFLAVSFINVQVYKIYRFHINGFIINMLLGPNAGDIFDFDTKLYIEEGLMFLLLFAVAIGLWCVARHLVTLWKRRYTVLTIVFLLLNLLVANGLHAYASFVVKPSVLLSARLIPYYFPLSATDFLEEVVGLKQDAYFNVANIGDNGELCYPLHPIEVNDSLAKRPNILLILIDSWSKLSLTPECMPNLWQLAHEEQWYQNHVSCGNGTMYGVFGLFTGLQPYYWPAFEGSHTSPVLIDRLMADDYDFRVYPSASIENPPFNRVLFQHVPNLRLETEGKTAYDRDQQIKKDLIRDLPELKNGQKPFFSFIFFDLLHAYSLPKELLNRFQPSWEYGDFARLNNDMDPTPFWNLYRNSAYQVDKMVGELIAELRRLDMYDNTLIFISGDHSQEYNENKKNYWGHNSNFSTYQIGVPLIVHVPGQEAATYTHRTTHYDFVPTLMHDYLGVTNPLDDYTAGRLLSDKTPRLWHFVGNELRYAFLVEGDTILTKEGAGWIEVTDAQLNIVNDYRINPKAFDSAIKNLNRFFK